MNEIEETEKKSKSFYSVLSILVLLSVIGSGMVYLRVFITHNIIYKFLIWNLFLAWIPMFAATAINKVQKYTKSNFIIFCLFCLWLVFFPNSPYIVTDLFHLIELRTKGIPMWYDLIMIFTFAWTGLIIGLYSLFEIHRFLKSKFKNNQSWLIVVILIFLGSFGVYLGRYQRWNSWNVLTHPIPLFNDLAAKIFNPFDNPNTMGFTLFFALFLLMSYLTIYAISEIKSN